MAERRFSALAAIKQRVAEAGAEPPPAEGRQDQTTPPPTPPIAVRPMGRPPGKRSHPDWSPRTILMRTKTHRRISGVLLDRDKGPDLSELIDQLLTEWLERQ
jgi:hypothetical protein